ncbi:cupin-like domain-containing protein [Chitinimonas sp. PSY-7]|uniref:cupin-like domain-containing protein n=1 Tax=Chitinimonas sp. PSY-7 TaxID=3459088 RepID=UPI00403FD638
MRNINQLHLNDAKKQFGNYIKSRTPVVIKGLFAGSFLEQLTDFNTALDRWSNVQLSVCNEHFYDVQRYEDACTQVYQTVCLGEFFQKIREKAFHPRMLSSARVAPKDIVADLNMEHMALLVDDVAEIRPYFFAGAKGNFAHLHYDGDYKHVLHYQICGRKTFVLIDPTQTRKLLPSRNWSCVSLENFTLSDFHTFLDMVDGWTITLEPGDTIYMPPTFWHYVAYEEDSLSVAFRYGRSKLAGILSTKFHEDVALQRLVYELGGPVDTRSEVLRFFKDLIEIYNRQYQDSLHKFHTIDAKYREIRAYFGIDINSGYFFAPDVIAENTNLRMLRSGYYYSDFDKENVIDASSIPMLG